MYFFEQTNSMNNVIKDKKNSKMRWEYRFANELFFSTNSLYLLRLSESASDKLKKIKRWDIRLDLIVGVVVKHYPIKRIF